MNETQTPNPEAVRPTKKQKELLAYIERFIAEHGYSPSYREIMNGLAYNSVATVALHVKSLISRGHLRKRDHSARSLEVVAHDETLTSTTPLPTNQVKASEEKWLVEKVEQLFQEAEQAPTLAVGQLENLYVLLGALRILNIEGAAISFTPRLVSLKAAQAEA